MGNNKNKMLMKKTKELSVKAITEPSSASVEQHTPRKRGRPRKVAIATNEDHEQQTTTTTQEQESEKRVDEITDIEGSSSSLKSVKDVEVNKESLIVEKPQEHHQPLRRSRARKKSKPTRSS